MTHTLSIANETVPAFKQSLEANKTDFIETKIEEGRTHFILSLKFANELFYLGVSYGINSLVNSEADKVDASLSN